MRALAASSLLPNRPTSVPTWAVLVSAWAAAVLLAWTRSPYATLPTPTEVARALHHLWWSQGLGLELVTTLKLIGHALLISVGVSALLAYSSVVAALRPLALGMSKLRFMGVAGLVIPFTLATGGGYPLKVALLVAGISTFLTTSLVQVVEEVPQSRLDYLRVLGASEAQIVWEGVVLGTLGPALDAVRQNLAMAWAMITMVEGISRAAGGIGAKLANQEKHWELPELYAVLLVVLVVGILLDQFMGILVDALCPYARLERAKR